MPTHAAIAVQLLRDAAMLFTNLGDNDPASKAQMHANAATYQQLAQALEQNPAGIANGKTHAVLAGELLRDTGAFFKTLAAQNEPIREQMGRTAEIYEHIAKMVAQNPQGVID